MTPLFLTQDTAVEERLFSSSWFPFASRLQTCHDRGKLTEVNACNKTFVVWKEALMYFWSLTPVKIKIWYIVDLPSHIFKVKVTSLEVC